MGIVAWHGDRILADVKRGTRSGFEQAGKQLANQAKADLSKPYPPASRPGVPPHRRTGKLAAAQRYNIIERGGEIELRVGSPDVAYGAIVASRRPWLAVSPTEALVTGVVADNVRRDL